MSAKSAEKAPVNALAPYVVNTHANARVRSVVKIRANVNRRRPYLAPNAETCLALVRVRSAVIIPVPVLRLRLRPRRRKLPRWE